MENNHARNEAVGYEIDDVGIVLVDGDGLRRLRSATKLREVYGPTMKSLVEERMTK